MEDAEAVLSYWFGSPRSDGSVAPEHAQRWFAASWIEVRRDAAESLARKAHRQAGVNGSRSRRARSRGRARSTTVIAAARVTKARARSSRRAPVAIPTRVSTAAPKP